MSSGVVFNIQKYSVQDGPGIRTTVFLKGCPLRCWWCHNPEGQSPGAQIVLVEGRCMECGECEGACARGLAGPVGRRAREGAGSCVVCGACVRACPTEARQMMGRQMEVGEVLEEVLKDRVFYEESGGGVTFSGGEPLSQFGFLMAMLRHCRGEGIRTALDTCGYAVQEELLAAAACAELVLYDLKAMDDKKHEEYTGVSNARILDNLRALGRAHDTIWIRMPIVPGLNDGEEEVEAAGQLLESVGGVRRVCLLPYHKIGSHKFGRLGRSYRLEGVEPPTRERLEELAGRFRGRGFEVRTGG